MSHSDKCASCGACKNYEYCQCCGKCRNCGNYHASPNWIYVNPYYPYYPQQPYITYTYPVTSGTFTFTNADTGNITNTAS